MRTKKTGFSSWLRKYYGNNASLSLKRDREAYVKSLNDYENALKPLERDLKKLLPLKLESGTCADVTTRCQATIKNYEESVKRYKDDIKKIDKRIEESEGIKKEKNIYKQIMKHKCIDSILVHGENLCIVTKSLKNHERKTLGRFLIKLDTQLRPYITINNLDYVWDKDNSYDNDDEDEDYNYDSDHGTYDHYHISNGEPCFDEYRNVINKYSEGRELYFTIDTIIQFLIHGDNQHSYYCDKYEWFDYRHKYKRNITDLL